MNKPGLILIGAGGHAHACIDAIEQHGQYLIAGLIGMPDEIHTYHFGYEVIGTDGDLQQVVKDSPYALIAVGQIQSPDPRIRLHQQALELGFQFVSIMAPTAQVSRHARIGVGTIVMHGAVVNAGATVGNNCIINTGAIVEHDVTVADHCHISTGAIVNGNAAIGAGSFVGSGAVIKEGVSVGQRCIVGMGLCVRHNLADYFRFFGNARA